MSSCGDELTYLDVVVLEITGVPTTRFDAEEVVAIVVAGLVAVADVVVVVDMLVSVAAARAEEIALPKADSATLATS